MALTYAANHPEIKSVFSIAGNDHGAFMKEYNRNPEMKNRIDEMFDDLEVLTATVRFGAGGTSKEIEELKFIESNPTFDLRYCVPMLALKNILLIGGWDNHMVSFEQIILPFYRALQDGMQPKLRLQQLRMIIHLKILAQNWPRSYLNG